MNVKKLNMVSGKLKKLLALAIVLCLTAGIGVSSTTACYASSVTHWAFQYHECKGNPSVDNIGSSSLSTVNGGEQINMIFQTTMDCQKIVAQIIQPGDTNWSTVETGSAKIVRWMNHKLTVKNKSGTLKGRFLVTRNGQTTEYRVPDVKVTAASGTSSLDKKISSFMADSRWKPGISWGDSQAPKLSTYSAKGCCAYVADAVRYIYGINNPRSGAKFTSSASIRKGDVIYCTPTHWFFVVSRSGNTLKIIEGNWSSKTRYVSITVNGNKFSNGKTFQYGYHYS